MLVGYALTPLGQVLFALTTNVWLVLIGRVLGWFGRGIRGPLRDALLAEAMTPATRGRAFGFHRAADTIGAVIGPVLGVALLVLLQDRLATDGVAPAERTQPYRWVFWLTLVPGALAVLSFGLLVRETRRPASPGMRFWATLRAFGQIQRLHPVRPARFWPRPTNMRGPEPTVTKEGAGPSVESLFAPLDPGSPD